MTRTLEDRRVRLGSTTTIARAAGVPWRLVGTRILVAPSGREDFESLMGGAAAIWLALESPIRGDELVDEIASAFGSEANVVRTDVAEAVDALCQAGLAERAEAGDG